MYILDEVWCQCMYNVSNQIWTYETKLISKYWEKTYSTQNVYSCNLCLCVIVCSLPTFFIISQHECILIFFYSKKFYKILWKLHVILNVNELAFRYNQTNVLECRVCVNFIDKRLSRFLKIRKISRTRLLEFSEIKFINLINSKINY